MHCSDDELLAYLDGELPALQSGRVGRHLKACWSCRTRLAQQEDQIHRLTVSMDEWHFPESGWEKDAKARLNEKMRAFDAELPAPVERRPRFGWALRSAMATAAALVLIAGGVYLSGRWSAPKPDDSIRAAANLEKALYMKPVRQTIAVDIVQLKPVKDARSARLQIWSDGTSGQYVSRLSDSQGALKQALWRGGPGREFIFRAAASQVAVQQNPHDAREESITALGDDGIELGQLESGFLTWLERREWRPIAFSSGMAMWTASDGMKAQAQLARATNGEKVIRITVERKAHRVVALLSVDLDAGNYRPRLQKVRFESPERTVEFSMTSVAVSEIQPNEVTAAVQSSDLPRVAEARPGEGHRPPETGADVPPRAELASVPAGSESEASEISAHYLLHMAGACLGEPVRVAGEQGGARVWKAGGEVENKSGSVFGETGLSEVISVLSDMRSARRQDGTEDAAGNNAEGMPFVLRHAAALRYLAEKFTSARVSSFSPHSRQVILSMVRDHTAALRAEFQRVGAPQLAAPMKKRGPADWQRSAVRLYAALAETPKSDSALGMNEASLRIALEEIAVLERLSAGRALEGEGKVASVRRK